MAHLDRKVINDIVRDAVLADPSPERFADLPESQREYAQRQAEMRGLSERDYFAGYIRPADLAASDDIDDVVAAARERRGLR